MLLLKLSYGSHHDRCKQPSLLNYETIFFYPSNWLMRWLPELHKKFKKTGRQYLYNQ